MVACLAVGLALEAALAPVATAGIGVQPTPRPTQPVPPGAPTDISRPVPEQAPQRNPVGDVGRRDDLVPEIWIPRQAVVLETNPPISAQTLFDGDALTGFRAEAGKIAAVRLDLGAAREVMGVAVHGTGRAKVAIYAEENGARRLLSGEHSSTLDLAPDRWGQISLPASSKAATLVVEWSGSPAAASTLTELAIWVPGRSRQALAEAAIADRLLTDLPENAVAATASPWTGTVARVSAHGPVSASFSVKLNRNPMLGRAFLVYEIEKKAHWTGVARSINGRAVRGGYRADAKGLGGVQVEEINPTWLNAGDNTVTFQHTLGEDGLGYNIRNVRIIGVPQGVDPAAAGASAPAGVGSSSPLADGDLETGVGGPGVHTAPLASLPDREPAFLSFYLDKPTGGTLTLSAEGQRKRRGQVRIDLDGRPAGWQTVSIAGVIPPARELRLRVQGDREGAGRIGEARIVSFPILPSAAGLIMSYPLHGECHEHKTYVRGFVAGVPGTKRHLFVDGQPRLGDIAADGSFEAYVEEPPAVKGKPWSIRLDVDTDNGPHTTRTVPIDTCVEAPKGRVIGVSPPVEDQGAPYGAVASPHKATTMAFADAKIDIPAGAVEDDVRLTMRALDKSQLRPLQSEMDNVIARGGALRFGPHGMKFKRPVRVTLPVDPAGLPQGMTTADVQIFFFDEASNKWTQLPQLRVSRDRVVAETTHFTDFIAATMRTPDHPDAQQFNPNTMKNVKAGDPGAGITLIQPPEANSSGSARLSYPIETPPGRNGIEPHLALTYDSDRVNTNGWLGVGWDLRMSSIEIDTRFGVPKYDGLEQYMLDGAMLTVKSTVGTTVTYSRRVEGSFDLIQRSGAGPTSYSWTVTNKAGTIFTYGTTASSQLANLRPNAPVACGQVGPACSGAIFRWYLEKVEDVFHNIMTISYAHDTVTKGTAPNTETLDEVYLSAIDYTSGPSLTAAYHVTFYLNTPGTRPDTTSNARPGFLVSTGRRLTDIKVKSGTTLVRQYRFVYHDQNATQTSAQNLADTMQKSVLDAVALWGTENDPTSELYRHTFEYNKAPATTAMFSDQQQTWGHVSQQQTPPSAGYGPRTRNGLSHSNDGLKGKSVMAGVGFPNFSVTGSFGVDSGASTTDLALFGVTGEGLPDQVDRAGTVSLNQKPAEDPYTNSEHFGVTALSGFPGYLGDTGRSGWTAAGDFSAMGDIAGGATLSYARHVIQDFGLVTDMNGDGFPDVVYSSSNNGFEAWINDGKRNFAHQSWANYSLTQAQSQFSTYARVAAAGAASAYFKTDPLVRWVAPFDGTVTVDSDVLQLYAGGGVRAELYIGNDQVRSVTLPANTPGASGVLATSVSKVVSAGDQIYARAVPLGNPSTNDAVHWPLRITYALPSGANIGDVDPSGTPLYRYRFHTYTYLEGFAQDYRGAGQARMPFHLSADGDISVVRCFYKSSTPDDVTVSVVIRNPDGSPALDANNNPRRWDKLVSSATVSGSTPICIDTLPPSSDANYSTITNVKEDQNVSYEITSDSPVEPLTVSLVANTVNYARYCRTPVGGGAKVCGTPQPSGSGSSIGPTDPYPEFPIPSEATGGTLYPYYQTYVRTIYNNGSSRPQPMRSKPAPASSVSFAAAVSASSPLTEDVLLMIQGVSKLHSKIRLQKGTTPSFLYSTPMITVNPNEPIFFTVYSPTVVGGNVNWSVAIKTTSSPTDLGTPVDPALINKAILDPRFDNNIPGSTTRDPMSGGFHNWFYGDWNDAIQFSVAHTSLTQRTPNPPSNNDAVVFGVPGTDHDLGRNWIGRGSSAIESYNIIPGAVSNPVAVADNAQGSTALRVSDTWNLELAGNLQGVTAAAGGGDAKTQIDFFDVNGDRFPDSITGWGVQFNDGAGHFSDRARVDMGFGDLRSTLNASLQAGISAGGGAGRGIINETLTDGSTKKVGATVSLGAATDYGVSSTRIDFADVNGDGLVDHVAESPSDGSLRVKLNLGYGFANEIPWGFPAGWNYNRQSASTLSGSTSVTVAGITSTKVGQVLNRIPSSPNNLNVIRLQDTGTFTASLGLNLAVLGGGGGPTWSVTRQWVDLKDVNGDGLPDQLLKVPGSNVLRVKLNKGDSFAAEQSWTLPAWSKTIDSKYGFLGTADGLSFSTMDGFSKNLRAEFCWFVCLGVSGFKSDSSGGPNADLEDIDGDGMLDHVLKVPGDEYVYTKLNRIGQTNLLSAVNRPLGGKIAITYARAGNHVDLVSSPSLSTPATNMPSNQWVMSWVVVNSESSLSWNASVRQKFDYTDPLLNTATGYYDYLERENLGYRTVKTIYPNEDVGGTSILRYYNNQNYYLRGLEAGAYYYQNDSTKTLLRSTALGYADPAGPNGKPPGSRTWFPAFTSRSTYIYETQPQYVFQMETMKYDANGNLTDVLDYGDVNDPNDDYNEHIDYQSPGTNITVPSAIATRTGVTLASGTLLRKRTATFFPTGKAKAVTDVVVNGKNPDGTARTETSPAASTTWTFSYDAFGNVSTAASPATVVTSTNAPTGHTLQYTYDPTAQTYVTSTKYENVDATFGYTSTADYDLRFGLPTRIIDTAGAKQEIDYDNYGRITKVFAPSDFATNGSRIDTNAPTIGVTYSEAPHTAGAAETLPAYAMVNHRTNAPGEGSLPGAAVTPSVLHTVNFIDGLKRSVQTKKDMVRDDGTNTLTTGMSVSGAVVFDARGRVFMQGQPTFAAGGAGSTAFVDVPVTNATQYSYDVLDRLRQEQHPDGGSQATTAISYGIGPTAYSIDGGRNYIIKTTTDPLYSANNLYHFKIEYLTPRGTKRLHWERSLVSGAVTDLFTLYDYDPLGQLTKVVDGKSLPIGSGNATTAEYDTGGNLIAVTSPDSGRREWRYCVGGYVCAEESPNARNANALIKYNYARDRLKEISYPSDTLVSYTYGSPAETGSGNGYKAGRVKSRTDEAGQFDYAYDALGNVTTETATLKNQMASGNYAALTTRYTWDNFGRLIDVIIPGATDETIRYGYDAGGNVTSAYGKQGTPTAAYLRHIGYDEFGQRVRVVYGNQAYSVYHYKPDTRRLSTADTFIQDIAGQPARQAQALGYEYDLVGNIKWRTEYLPFDTNPSAAVPVGGWSELFYHYDPLNQLTHADLNGQSRSTQRFSAAPDMTYDAIGNIKTKIQINNMDDLAGNVTGRGSYSYTMNYNGTTYNTSPHAPSSITEVVGGVTSTRSLAYDRNGNLTSSSYVAGTGRTIAWTDTDRVRSIRDGTATNYTTVTQALYSADGTRTHNKVTQNSSTTETLYVNQFLTVRNGAIRTKHVYAGEQRIASKLEPTSGAASYFFYHPDNLQSTQYVTDANQALVQHLEYFPSGEIWREENDNTKLLSSAAPHATAFSGKELDASGYQYFGARYYDPKAQIWLSPDPILASYMQGGPNGGAFQPRNLGLYTYVWNSPLGLRDPDGRAATEAGCAMGGLGGCAAGVVIDFALATFFGVAIGGTSAALLSAPAGAGTYMSRDDAQAKLLVDFFKGRTDSPRGLMNENVSAKDGPTVNAAGRGTKKNPATTEDVLKEKLGRQPTTKEVENYENQIQQEASSGQSASAQQRSDRPASSSAEHTSGARMSTKKKHEEGQARAGRDAPGGEKGDARRRY